MAFFSYPLIFIVTAKVATVHMTWDLRDFIAVECTRVRNSQSLKLSQTCIGQVFYAVPQLFLRRLFQKYHPLPCSTDLLVSHTVYCTTRVLLPCHVTAMLLNGCILPLQCVHMDVDEMCGRCSRKGVCICMSSGIQSFRLLNLMALL